MITEQDLQEAIAECQGQKNPNANTCIKLAAFLTIQKEMFGKPDTAPIQPMQPIQPVQSYSYAAEPMRDKPDDTIDYQSESEFARLIHGKSANDAWAVMDELMDTLEVVYPRLYNSVIGQLT